MSHKILVFRFQVLKVVNMKNVRSGCSAIW